MAERLSNVRSPIEQMVWDHHDIWWHFTERKKAADELNAAVDSLEAMNNTLPRDTHRFETTTNPMTKSAVYEWDTETGEYKKRCAIETGGAGYSFYGDHLEVIDDTLVLIDTELGGGLEVLSLRVTPLEQIQGTETTKRFGQLLDMIAEIEPGENKYFDCLYF